MGRQLRLAAAVSATAAAAMVAAQSASALPGVGVSVPAPQLPSLPSAPAAPAPVPRAPVSAPAVPHAPSLPAVRAPAVQAPATPPLPGVAAVVAAEGTARPATAMRLSGASSSGNAGTTASPAGSGSERRLARAQERTESRRLRTEVSRLKGCLGVLPELARNLIELRAGVNGPAMSRRAAAKELKIGMVRARRIERRGLRTMRRASRQGVCGGGSTTAAPGNQGFRSERTSAVLVETAANVTPAAAPAPAPAAAPAQHAKQPARQGVLGETAKSPPPASAPGPLPGSRVALSRAGGHGHTLVISLVLLLLAANLLAGGLWLLRRRNERDTLAAATGRRRPYQDPGHELRFGSEQNEAPERPAEAEAQAAAERRDSS